MKSPILQYRTGNELAFRVLGRPDGEPSAEWAETFRAIIPICNKVLEQFGVAPLSSQPLQPREDWMQSALPPIFEGFCEYKLGRISGDRDVPGYCEEIEGIARRFGDIAGELFQLSKSSIAPSILAAQCLGNGPYRGPSWAQINAAKKECAQIDLENQCLKGFENLLSQRKKGWRHEAFERARNCELDRALKASQKSTAVKYVPVNVPDVEKPEGLSCWEDLEISFLSDHRVEMRTPEKRENLNYADMGFEDRRSKNPNMAWETLRNLSGSGTISESSGPGFTKLEKRVEKIRKNLRKRYSLSADPLPYIKGTGYRARFKISRAPSFEY